MWDDIATQFHTDVSDMGIMQGVEEHVTLLPVFTGDDGIRPSAGEHAHQPPVDDVDKDIITVWGTSNSTSCL